MSGSRSTAIPFAVGSFGFGTLAIGTLLALYATGHTDLPLWLDLATLLAPVGLVTGVVAVVVRAMRPSNTARHKRDDAINRP